MSKTELSKLWYFNRIKNIYIRLIYIFIKYFNIHHLNKKGYKFFKLQKSEILTGSDKFGEASIHRKAHGLVC